MIDNDKANASIQKTEGLAGKLGAGLGKGIGIAAKWGAALAVAGATAAIALGGTALKAAVSFEKQMANVATLLDGDVKSKIGNLGGAVKKLSSDTGTSVELLTDGLYQVVSAFGETDDAMKILEIATKGAAAGNATVTDSVNLLSAVTKGYGDTSSEAAQQTSDLAFLTVKLGQTTFPELASSMGKVIPLAGSLAVKQTDLFGAMATLTGVTGNTAEVSTQLRGVMQGLLKPSTSMTAALEEMGFKSGGAAIESLGLQGTLDGLKGTVNGNDTALLSMFGSVEAGGAVLALTGAQADNFTEKTKAMGDATGATEAAFKTQQKTVSAMMAKMKASFEVVMITVGEKLLPVFNDFLEWILLHMPQIKETMEIVFEFIGKAVDIVVGIFKDVLIPAFQLIYDWVQKHWPIIQETIKTVTDVIVTIIQGFVDIFTVIWDKYGTNILNIITIAWDLIKGVFKAVTEMITGIVDAFVALFEGDWEAFGDAIWGIMKTYWEYIRLVFKTVIDLIKEIMTIAIGVLKGIATSIMTAIWDAFKSVWDSIKTWNDTVWTNLKNAILGFKDAFFGVAKTVFTFLWDGLKNIWNLVIGWIDKIFPGTKAKIEGFKDQFKTAGISIFTGLWDGVKQVWENIQTWVSAKVKWIAEKVRDWENAANSMSNSYSPNTKSNQIANRLGGSFKTGTDYIPYDEFPAVLHKGEAVLTAQENKDYKANKGSEINQTVNIYSPTALSPSETARRLKNASRELALGV